MDNLILPEILYEDQYLLCIHKPAGLLSIRDGYNPLLPHAASLLSPAYGPLWIVHRLDRDTSGTLLLARTRSAHRTLNIAFENRQVHKTYHALVRGRLPEGEKMIDLPLKINGDRRHRTIIDQSSGKPAQTRLRLLRTSGQFSLVETQPITGYTHQIRAHLLAIGFPILADALYSLRTPTSPQTETDSTPELISRLALHAYSIEFSHPITNLLLIITAPYPPDFSAALEKLNLR